MSIIKTEKSEFPTSVQVLIVGAGACGTIAALAANERGAETLILERDAKPMGNTSLSGGQIPAAGTKLQRAAGLLDDTPELLYQDILAKSHGECDHEIARHIAYEAAKTIEWLVDRYQLPGSCVLDFQYPGHSRPHMHPSPSRHAHGAVGTPHGMHLAWPHLTEGGFHVNQQGRRFSNENAGYSEQALKVHRQPEHVAWAIWDERCERIALQQHSHVLANESGAIKRFDSAESMAQAIGCDANVLKNTI